MKVGQNDMSGIIWAPLVCFFHVLCVLTMYFILLFLGPMYILKVQGLWWALKHGGTMKMGPNNARCVVWALGEFFYILNHVFLYVM